MLDIINLSAGYGSLNAIQNINISIPDGSKLGVFGHNGAGKTTLMRCIIGAHVPSQGEVRWRGEALPQGDVPATVKKGIAYVPQGHNVFPTLSVEKNLRIAGSLFGEEFLMKSTSCFLCCSSVAASGRGRCRAASSRCWRSAWL
jgi:branched-chain amino acid transport system ATP-binding protein